MLMTEEINKMIEFYQTPLGKKMESTKPQNMQESIQAGQSSGKEYGDNVYNRLKQKRYVKVHPLTMQGKNRAITALNS